MFPDRLRFGGPSRVIRLIGYAVFLAIWWWVDGPVLIGLLRLGPAEADGTAGDFGLALWTGLVPVLGAELFLHRRRHGRLEDYARLIWTVLDQLPATISIKDRQRRYLLVNRTWEAYKGISQAEVRGRLYDDLVLAPVDPDDLADHRADVRARDEAVLASGLPLLGQEEAYRDRQGGRRTLLSNKVPLLDAAGVPQGILSVTMDISERKRLEVAARELRAQAEAANRAKSEFLATISHELRTPLNGVSGMAELLRETRLDGDQAMMVQIIQQSAEILIAIINDLLDLSRIDAGRFQLEESRFDLRALAESAATMVAPSLAGKELDFLCTIDPALFMVCRGDGNRLRQAMLNLLSNAVKFTASGSVLFEMRAVPAARPGELGLHCLVRDTGIGIAPEHLPRLFQRFTQLDASLSRRHGGAGLGLAISKSLIDMMGGTIGVDSRPGVGSTFWFRVDLAVVEPAGPPALPPAGSPVLVLGPPADVRTALCRQLEDLGLAVDAAALEGMSVPVPLPGPAAGQGPWRAVFVTGLSGAAHGLSVMNQLRGQLETARTVIVLVCRPVVAESLQAHPRPAAVRVLGMPLRPSCLVEALAAGPNKPVAAGSRRVLVADPNPVTRQITAAYLRRLGFTTEPADSGAAAVAVLRQAPCRIALLTIDLPDLSGPALADAIRSLPGGAGRLPLIALVAGPGDTAVPAGFDNILARPITFGGLRRALEAYVPVTDLEVEAGP